MQNYNPRKGIVIFAISLLFIVSCSYQELLDKANVQKPGVDVAGVKISGLSFKAVDLLFDLSIRNPNSIGVSLAGFDYDFRINENSFVSGRNSEGLQLKAKAENVIQLPVILKFNDLFRTYKTLKDQDSSKYNLSCSFSFNLPVLGAVKIPVSKSGNLPVLKLPTISLADVKLNKLSFTGADLKLVVKMKNNNPLTLFIDTFNYQFSSGGNQWISGIKQERIEVQKKSEKIIEIPVSLNFLQMGRSIYQVVANNQDFNYKFSGDVDFSTSAPLIGQVKLPFDKTGKIKVTR